jgi:hypothetical protein
MKKTKLIYKTIPVRPEVYDRVRLISEANGFGERGMGAQVAQWAGRELPECEHEKQAVQIETFFGGATLAKSVIRAGYFCPTCMRVYASKGQLPTVKARSKKEFA